MPIYEFIAKDPNKSCPVCRQGFELLLRVNQCMPALCPDCGVPVRKCISVPNVGVSVSNFDDRAKSTGFHKLKKTGQGEYEKLY